MRRGRLRQQKSDFGGAIGDYTNALTLDETLIEAYKQRAVCWTEVGEM